MKMTLYLDITDYPDDKKLKLNADKDIIMTPDGKSYIPITGEVIPSAMVVKFLETIKP